MAFDPTTAQPEASGFDPTTAKIQNTDILDPLIRMSGVPFGIPYNTPIPTSEQMAAGGNPGLAAANQTARDALSIPTNFLNQSMLNYPRSIANKMGYDLPTESQSGAGEVANKVAGVAGAVTSPAYKALGLINPVNPVLSNIARGAVAGAAYAPTNDPLDMKSRAVGAMVGGSLNPVLAGASGTLNAIKPSFFDSSIMPRINKLFNDSVGKWGDSIQDFATKKLNIPQDVVDHIDSRTPAQVEASSNALGNTHDTIAQSVQNGFQQKLQEMGQAYHDAFASGPANVRIPLTNTQQALTTVLKNHGLIDDTGTVTQIGEKEVPNTALGKLLNIYQAHTPNTGIQSTIFDRSNPAPINEAMWYDKRGQLNAVRNSVSGKDGKLSSEVTDILDGLYNDAEEAGVPINNARNLARQYFQNVDTAKITPDNPAGQFTEPRLRNIFNNTSQSERDLQKVGSYLGQDFVTPSKDIAANQSLQKLKGLAQSAPFKPSLFEQRLEPLQNITQIGKAKPVKQEFEDLLGKSPELDGIFKDLTFRRYSGAAITGAIGGLGLAAHGMLSHAGEHAKKAVGIDEDSQ